MRDLDSLLEVAQAAADLGRDIAKNYPHGRLENKGDRDYASQVDLEIERVVREFLADRTPRIAFLGEENGPSGELVEGLSWVLDPLDGTANFVHGIPLYAISLGLLRGTRPILGVVDFPGLDERFHAAEGLGAYLGHKKISCGHKVSSLRDSIVSVGDYAVGEDADEKNQHRLALTRNLAARSERVRMFGSAAVDLTWVASGRTDAYVALSNKPWDMAAGVVIVREAGGTVVDVNGTEHTTESSATVATSHELVDEVLRLVQDSTRS